MCVYLVSECASYLIDNLNVLIIIFLFFFFLFIYLFILVVSQLRGPFKKKRYLHFFAFAYKECASPLYYILYTLLYLHVSRYNRTFSPFFYSLYWNIQSMKENVIPYFFHPTTHGLLHSDYFTSTHRENKPPFQYN